MGKRTKENITLGSGKVYVKEYTAEGGMPKHTDLCTSDNLLGYIQGGATLEYAQETHEEKDDLGIVSKVVVTSEEAILKLGVLTWNGKTLQMLVDRCKVTEAEGIRTIHLGGAGNAQGKEWVVCFAHEDKKDGNLWAMIRGNNQGGLTLTFATDSGTKLEPEFKAMPQDSDGTLVALFEEMGAT